jgi:hypothetical protein
MDSILIFVLFRQDYQDYQEFFACGEGLSAEGRIILTILLILSNYFFNEKNPFLFSNYMVSYLIKPAASQAGGCADNLQPTTYNRQPTMDN